jgi:flagellar protein FlaG
MVSEITPQGSKSPPPAVLASAHATAPAPKAAEIKVPAAPKVVAPKPVAIQFDPAKAQQNLAAAVNLLNEQMVSTKRGLGFSFDNSTNGPVIKVSNTNTGEVIRQIPTADVLHMAHKIDDLKGILYNKVA